MKPPKSRPPGSRFEFRAWTDGGRAREQLESWAQNATTERLHDCYLVGHDPTFNIKIRNGELKLKQLLGERHGFQLWDRIRKRDFARLASPFYTAIEGFSIAEPNDHRAIAAQFNSTLGRSLSKRDALVLAVPVTKKRRLFRLGSLRGEVTQVKFATGKRLKLTTVAIDGPNLGALVALRAKLGLDDEPNQPYHLAVRAPKLLLK